MIELPDGDDYGIAIKLGRYDESNLMELLRYIEGKYPEVTWLEEDRATDFVPDLTMYDEEDEEISDFVLFIERENELAWGCASDIDFEEREYDYVVYTPYEFMNDGCEETEIENEMDVSFLFN